jgi:hypothetical protein
MFDNLREQANSTPFYEEEALFREAEGIKAAPRRKAADGRFLGMSPLQRFVVAVMLLIAICALGSMCLLITGRIGMV